VRLGSACDLYSPKVLKNKESRDWEADTGVGDFGKEIRRWREEGAPDTWGRGVSDRQADARRTRVSWACGGSAQSGRRAGGPVREREAELEQVGASGCWATRAQNREGERNLVLFLFFSKQILNWILNSLLN
jgi:hypothetical protein